MNNRKHSVMSGNIMFSVPFFDLSGMTSSGLFHRAIGRVDSEKAGTQAFVNAGNQGQFCLLPGD
ncbi:hypothetical protein IFT48_28015 [Pseudomonas fluorescens]|uniref:hypothetical protein n=1 Tax=Pseudomonas TaxID=286 RepID=UPI00190547F6|nr:MULTISPECIES: hypothetical protein [Pseudomonas]MBD8093842.1 hypothetical protein [Pseudomonas fluorescens]MBD8719845.1 hypothetical protein [Pseudomonas fluorescens]MDL2186419.1 hypothetical protein [Pseudomonas sp. ChxA]